MFQINEIQTIENELAQVLPNNNPNAVKVIVDSYFAKFLSNPAFSGFSNVAKVSGNKSIGTYLLQRGNNQIAIERITHNTAKDASSNAVAVSKLEKFYVPNQQGKNISHFLYLLIINYDQGMQNISVSLKLIESIPVSEFNIGNLGQGQIQLKNQTHIGKYSGNRNDWMKEFYDALKLFYDNTASRMQTSKQKASQTQSLW